MTFRTAVILPNATEHKEDYIWNPDTVECEQGHRTFTYLQCAQKSLCVSKQDWKNVCGNQKQVMWKYTGRCATEKSRLISVNFEIFINSACKRDCYSTLLVM